MQLTGSGKRYHLHQRFFDRAKNEPLLQNPDERDLPMFDICFGACTCYLGDSIDASFTITTSWFVSNPTTTIFHRFEGQLTDNINSMFFVVGFTPNSQSALFIFVTTARISQQQDFWKLRGLCFNFPKYLLTEINLRNLCS